MGPIKVKTTIERSLMRYLLLLVFALSCSAAPSREDGSQKSVDPNEEHTPPPADPTGVKNAKNVPMLGQEALSAEYEKQKKCIDACVKSRQPEAIAFELIEEQCTASCRTAHFIGQVRVSSESIGGQETSTGPQSTDSP